MKSDAIAPAKPVAIQEVSRDNLFEQISEWTNRIAERAYELFAGSGFTNGHDLDDWFKAEQELLKPVTVDIKATKDEFIVTAEVPGFEAEDLDIQVNGSCLVIKGTRQTTHEKKEREGETVYSERRSEQMYRTFQLPAPVLADKAQAELKNSMLELKLPKAETSRQLSTTAA